MTKLASYKWSFLALGLLLGGLMASRGGLAVLGGMGRFIIPMAVLYLGFRWAKTKFLAAAQDALRKHMQAQRMGWPPNSAGGPFGRPQGGQGQTIDLCPRCGSYLAPGHRCPK